MTADGPAQEIATGVVLEMCDKLLGEVGRRSHRFSWLRAPGGMADAWLPVEAYYPRHRLVVICHSERAPYDHLFAQLVPQHGLRLLEFAPAELGADPAIAEQLLGRMIARLPEPPGREPAEEVRPRTARAPRVALAARGRPARPEHDRPEATAAAPAEERRAPRLPALSLPSLPRIERRPRPERPAPERHAPERPRQTPERLRPAPVGGRAALRPVDATAGHTESVAVGVVTGLALALVCGGELVLAVIVVALDSGRVVLGLGLAIDACARFLGTLDAGRVGKSGWAWASAIVGSPAVMAAAVLWPRPRRPGRMTGPGDVPIEAAPFAGLIATVALVCVLIGLVS